MNNDPTITARDEYLYSLALQACIYCWPLYEMQRMRAATSARKAPGLGFVPDRGPFPFAGAHSTARSIRHARAAALIRFRVERQVKLSLVTRGGAVR